MQGHLIIYTYPLNDVMRILNDICSDNGSAVICLRHVVTIPMVYDTMGVRNMQYASSKRFKFRWKIYFHSIMICIPKNVQLTLNIIIHSLHRYGASARISENINYWDLSVSNSSRYLRILISVFERIIDSLIKSGRWNRHRYIFNNFVSIWFNYFTL